MDEQSPLPRVVELSWGLRDRARPGPKPGLTLEGILRVAAQIADAEGLAALSMGRLAAELGFTTMSLYRYVASKDELLVLLMDTAVGQPPPHDVDLDSRAGLEAWARAMLAAYRAHPWGLRIPISGPPMTPNLLRWMENGLRPLAEAGLSEQEKLSVILLVSSFVRSQATLQDDLSNGLESPAGLTGQIRDYEQTLARVLDPQAFPALSAAMSGGGMSAEDINFDFEFGLSRVLDGVEAFIQRRGTSASGAGHETQPRQ